MDTPKVALQPLLDHIAGRLAVNYVEQMEEIPSADPPEAPEREEGGQ